ncbi:hypothetical protein CKO19_09280, partial [Rhodovulum adriaticum]|nr:hypothetical protein [Rhodovulum adriaticum]
MGKGLVSGIIWGVIVSVLVLVLLALTTPVPQRGGTGLARPAEAPASGLPSGAQTPDADEVTQGAAATGETPAGETDEAAPSREQGAPAAVPEQAQDGPLQEPVMENTAAGRGVAPTAPTTSVPEAPPVADPAADAPVAAPATSPAVDIVLPEGSAFGRPEGLERNDLPGEAPAPRTPGLGRTGSSSVICRVGASVPSGAIIAAGPSTTGDGALAGAVSSRAGVSAAGSGGAG